VSSNEDAGPQSIAKFATSISSGGGGFESTQTLSAFVVTSDHPEYFSSLPAIDPDGKLTYTAAANVSGGTTISVTLKDNGGIARLFLKEQACKPSMALQRASCPAAEQMS